MKSSRQVPVAIVGGGFSGTILAAQLARRGIACALIDGSGCAGRGVAYSTTEPAHLLNVPADGMSAWPDEPDHFAERFASEGGDPQGFAPRRLFGRYLGDILKEAAATGKTEVIHAKAVKASRNRRWSVELDDGRGLEAQALVLAIGNQEPQPLSAFAGVGDRFIGNPWGEEAREAVASLTERGGTALLIGTGLTMVDVVLSLDSAGHRGPIIALSRRGLIPRSHADYEPSPVESEELPRGCLRSLSRWLRRRSAEVGWRAAVDSLRPHTRALWQQLGAGQQRRFLRHGRAWWDVHRSRIAPEVARTIARLIAEGRLQVLAGRIIGARETGAGLEVAWRRRGSNVRQTIAADYAFNCTGPLHSIARTKDPLLRSLLDAGQVRADQLGIGLDVGNDHRAGADLWALGPLTKGCYWEIIAVPDIREQAAAVADYIARDLHA